MKILSSASFEYHEHVQEEELMFIFFGPVTKPAKKEKYYLFTDSQKRYPDIIHRITVYEGNKLKEQQKEQPALVYADKFQYIFWFKDHFVRCTKDELDMTVVRGLVLDKVDRGAKRIERLRRRGEL
jgi:hypothetical protein